MRPKARLPLRCNNSQVYVTLGLLWPNNFFFLILISSLFPMGCVCVCVCVRPCFRPILLEPRIGPRVWPLLIIPSFTSNCLHFWGGCRHSRSPFMYMAYENFALTLLGPWRWMRGWLKDKLWHTRGMTFLDSHAPFFLSPCLLLLLRSQSVGLFLARLTWFPCDCPKSKIFMRCLSKRTT